MCSIARDVLGSDLFLLVLSASRIARLDGPASAIFSSHTVVKPKHWHQTNGLPNFRSADYHRLLQTTISSPNTNFYLPKTNSNVWES